MTNEISTENIFLHLKNLLDDKNIPPSAKLRQVENIVSIGLEKLSVKDQEEIHLTDDEIMDALHLQLDQWDADEIADIAGEWFGGRCWTDDGIIYTFIPIPEEYNGAFDSFKENEK